MDKTILTSRDVMAMLCVCENTLLKMESDGRIKVDFRIGNRKRYYLSNITKSLSKLNLKR
ncbi:hypothetical protein N8987_04895 [Crocinitomix sp.]|nr:hypothetical protein [Crocinitomix sp.]